MPRGRRSLPAALLFLVLAISLGLAERLPGPAVLLAASSFLAWAVWMARRTARSEWPTRENGGDP